MRTITKLIAVLILLLVATAALFLLKGCGKAFSGGACGGCPDTTAPQGSTVTPPSSLTAATIAPASGACYPSVPFQFTGADGIPLNDICVEITTNGLIALHTGDQPANCASVVANPQTYIRTRTNNAGVVILDFVASCSGFDTATTSINAFITAQSCAAVGTVNTTITVSGTGCP